MQGREASGALLVVLLRGFLPSSSIPTSAASPHNSAHVLPGPVLPGPALSLSPGYCLTEEGSHCPVSRQLRFFRLTGQEWHLLALCLKGWSHRSRSP